VFFKGNTEWPDISAVMGNKGNLTNPFFIKGIFSRYSFEKTL